MSVSPGASYFGLIRLIQRVGLVRKVQEALEDAPELAGLDQRTGTDRFSQRSAEKYRRPTS
jgi:hypothetical protein